jgi:hypothetical protein
MTDLISIAVGVIGLTLAFYQYRQRVRVETILRDNLRRLAGEVSVMYSNARWSEGHMVGTAHLFVDSNPDLTAIRKHVADGVRDATACSRQVS